MEPRRRRGVRVLAAIAAALWIAFLISTATVPEGDEAVDGSAALLRIVAVVVTVVTVALAARPGATQPEGDTARGASADR